MFLLHTNVISNLRRPKRIPPAAARWFQSVDAETLHISVVTVFEIQHGIVELRRRDAKRAAHLQNWLDSAVLSAFAARIAALDTVAAQRSAELHSGRKRLDADRLIAAIALSQGMTVVTRNIRDFASMGVETFDPFQSTWTSAALSAGAVHAAMGVRPSGSDTPSHQQAPIRQVMGGPQRP